VAATASTVRSTSAVRVPWRRAASTAAWIVGPSISGSVYGSPTSTTSAPASTMARIADAAPWTLG
jgi:hypothetical protein